MAQPPLSQSIRRFEESLGSRLFVRTRRRVELTAAGDALLAQAPEILNRVECAEQAVRAANQSGTTRVKIGFTPNALSDLVPAAMTELRRHAPLVEIDLWEGSTEDQIEALSKGSIDVGFFHPPAPEISGLEIHIVERPALVAAIPKSWPLAEKANLKMIDLHDLPVMISPARNRPDFHFAIITAFHRAQVSPRFSEVATFAQTRLQLAASGMGVALVSEGAARHGYAGVEIRRIEDLDLDVTLDVGMAWRKRSPASLQHLFQTVCDAVKRA